MTKRLSPQMEMYLKTILRLEPSAAEGARVRDIAATLAITMPSVSEALRSLAGRGLVRHPAYGAVTLTARGRRAASDVNRRYEVLRRFFIDVLHVDRKIAEREACEIEHVTGPDTLRRLTAFLDYVSRCRMDVRPVIVHFHEYLEWRLNGDYCHDCEGGDRRPANCPMPDGPLGARAAG